MIKRGSDCLENKLEGRLLNAEDGASSSLGHSFSGVPGSDSSSQLGSLSFCFCFFLLYSGLFISGVHATVFFSDPPPRLSASCASSC